MQVQAPSPNALGESRRRAIIEVARRAVVATRADGIAIALRNGSDVVCEISLGIAPPRGTVVEARSSLSSECMQTAAPVYCADTAADSRYEGTTPPFRSVLLVPVIEWGSATGFCGAFSGRPNAFTAEQIRLLTEVVSAIAGDRPINQATWGLQASSAEPPVPHESQSSHQKLLREIEEQIADWEKQEKRSLQRRKIALVVFATLLIVTSITVAAVPQRIGEWLRRVTALFHTSSPQPAAPASSQGSTSQKH